MLIVARCLMGVAAALIFPATLAILSNVFTDAKERAAAIGVWTGITGLAVALGPLTGGLLLQHFSWGSVFFFSVPVAAVALALGVYGRVHHPTDCGINDLGFLSLLAMKGWLATGAVLLAVFQLPSALRMYGRLRLPPTMPRWPSDQRQW